MSFVVVIVLAGVIGGAALRWLPLRDVEAVVFRVYAGLPVLAVLVLVLGSWSLRVAQLAVIAFALMAVAYAVRRRGLATVSADEGEYRLFTRLEWACLGTMLAANVLTLLSALAPNTSWDAAVAHLALPAAYAREGRILFLEGNPYSAYPHLLHALHAWLYYQGGETAVGLFNWTLGALACAAVYVLGNRIDGRRCGLIAAALFATAPIYFDQAGNGLIDAPYAGFIMAALAALAAWHDERRASWLVLAAFLIGASAGIRQTSYLIAALCAIGVVILARERRFRATAVFAGVVALAAAPWLIHAAVAIGNPVYPFLRGVFESRGVPDMQSTAFGLHESVQASSLTDFLMFPWNIIMRPHWYDGWSKSPGGLLLFLGPPGLIVGGARARWLGAFSIAGGIGFYFFQRIARYLLPFFVPLMVVSAMAADRLGPLRRPIAILLLVFFGYGLMLGVAVVHFKVPVVLGLVNREDYLTDRVERYAAFQWVNEHLPPDAVVFTLDPRGYYIRRRVFQNAEVLDPMRVMSFDQQLNWLQDRGITHVFLPLKYYTGSPLFRVRGFDEVIEPWRVRRERFRLLRPIVVPVPGTDEVERVEVYEIDYGGPGRRARP